MLQSLMWIGFGAFFVVSLTVGVRLVALWWRDRELPQLLIGLGVLGIGPIGFGCQTLGQILYADYDVAARAVFATGLFAASGGAFAKYIFNYTVYHPGSRAVRGLAYVAGVGLLVTCLWAWASNGFARVQEIDTSYFIRSVLQVSCLLWGSVEALRYWLMMRRRVRLGLADPVVTNRFFMWGVGAGAAGVGTVVGIAAPMLIGRPPLEIPWVTLSSSMHGLLAAVALSLAFLPTPAYKRFLLERAERRVRA
jgi:hypothetical protein